jgi:DNA-binding beta-propeller fold protein YncE
VRLGRRLSLLSGLAVLVCVMRLAVAGSASAVVVSTFASGFWDPYGLAFDASGNLYVANAGNDTISEVTPAGAVSQFATGFTIPVELAFDASGNLYVANADADTVSEITGSTAQSITFVKPGPYTYGVAPVTLAATASSDLPVSYTVTNGGPCSVSGSTLTLTGAGSCVVKASQSGNLTYKAAKSISRTIVIDKAATTLTATSSTRTPPATAAQPTTSRAPQAGGL